MNSNIGGDDIPRGAVSLKDDMDAFDALPAALRAQLASMSINWNAEPVRKILDGYGHEVAVAVLGRAETQMQCAYRERIAA